MIASSEEQMVLIGASRTKCKVSHRSNMPIFTLVNAGWHMWNEDAWSCSRYNCMIYGVLWGLWWSRKGVGKSIWIPSFTSLQVKEFQSPLDVAETKIMDNRSWITRKFGIMAMLPMVTKTGRLVRIEASWKYINESSMTELLWLFSHWSVSKILVEVQPRI